MSYQTVERYVRSDACPDWQPGRRRPSRLDRFEGHIRQRVAGGCGNARQILRELHAMGYRGGKTVVQQHVKRLKVEVGHPPVPEPEAAASGCPDVPSLRRLAVTIVRRPTDRQEEDQRALAALCPGDGLIREAAESLERFSTIVRDRSPQGLTDWFAEAGRSAVPEIRSFAQRLRQDEAAVRSGVTLEWSNGPVEGHINRLKVIKRSMYGRARFDLLRARVLAAA
jgi:transposase